jgi:hypothetical protein
VSNMTLLAEQKLQQAQYAGAPLRVNGGTSKVSRSLCRELAAVRRRIEDMEQQFILRTGYRPSQVSMAHREKNLKISAQICHYFMALL